MWFKSTGKIVYNPRRPNMKKKTQWWCVLEVDKEITRYYRWWIQRRYHIKRLFPPSWDAHVSVIRGERPAPDLMHLWKKYDGKFVEFEYEHYPKSNGESFWLVDVKCPHLTNIRRELNRPHDWSLHLTVGRIWL